jgi:AsmA protein
VVNAQFSAGGLNLVPLMGSGGESAPSTAGWSKDPIDASALGLIDGEIGLSAESIDLGSAKLGKTRAIVAIKNSRAVVTLREAHIYDGVASGKVVANNRKGFSARADVSIAGLELQKLLSETAGVTRLSGKGKADISVLASGKSMHALMNSLDGSGSVDVGQGKISGIDLDRLLRGQPGGGTTVFDALSGSFVIKKGILSNDDLLLSLPSVIAKGAGTVGIGPRNIDDLFTPQLRSETDDVLAAGGDQGQLGQSAVHSASRQGAGPGCRPRDRQGDGQGQVGGKTEAGRKAWGAVGRRAIGRGCAQAEA